MHGKEDLTAWERTWIKIKESVGVATNATVDFLEKNKYQNSFRNLGICLQKLFQLRHLHLRHIKSWLVKVVLISSLLMIKFQWLIPSVSL